MWSSDWICRSLLVSLVATGMVLSGCGGDLPADGTSAEESSFGEPFRPQFHYTPERNWMNDPNGLVYHDGTYHLFHQYNPEGNTWGHMSWNHATSTDLVHWSHQGVAIREEGNEMVFSGSAVVDSANTAGFRDRASDGPSPIVAVYTSHYTLGEDSIDQAQSLAYSLDAGDTWTKYEGNPVLQHPDPNFRDPNVFWYEPGEKWVMVVALPTQRTVQFYESRDLTEWSFMSEFGPAGAIGGIWECPALFRVPVEGEDRLQWVLQIDLNPGAVAGGSGSQYFLGAFDGKTFVPHAGNLATAPHWVDYGPDFYAAIPWNHVPASDGRTLWIGWMNNWSYAERIPTSPWRSAQTIPRSLRLRKVNGSPRLTQHPIEELQHLREDPVEIGRRTVQPGTTSLGADGVSGRTLELLAEFVPADAETVGLAVREGADEETVVGYDASNDSVFVDRRRSGSVGFDEGFAARDTAPLEPENGRVRLHVFVDRSSVEVFANDGARVLTHRIFPDPRSDGVSLIADGGSARLVRLDAWTLNSIWEQ